MNINAVSPLPHILPATPPPPAHEKSLTPLISTELKNLQDLSRQLSESPHEKGYLRFSKEGGWKFSPNMSLRDQLHIRDAGYSHALINPSTTKPIVLAKPGEKIALTTLNSRLQALIGSYPVPAQKLEQVPTPAVVTEPHENLSPAAAKKPTPAPRTIFPQASAPRTPIPALRTSLPDISQVMDAYIQAPVAAPRRRASAPVDSEAPSVKALTQTWEAMGRA